MLEVIHVAAAVLGIAGAVLLSARCPVAALAVWVPADALWVAWAIGVDDTWTGAQFAVFFAVASSGLWNWTRGRRSAE